MRVWAFWIGLILLVLLAGVVAPAFDFHVDCSSCWLFRRHRHGSFERTSSTTLKTICSAQADFRANDRDGDGVNQFWRADIAGLYAMTPGGGPAIRLIELSTALADARPAYDLSAYGPRAPRAGYWFRALRHADEKDLDAVHRFAAVAYPADYPKSGRYTFIVDENNTLFRADLGHGRGIEVFPTDEELQKQWAKFD
jgi:hypothetical protein